jgi:Tfp pilus assembly protein PilF
VRLVRVADEAPLWTEHFDAQVTNLFAIQDSIAERVAAALEVHLSGEQTAALTRRGTQDPEAYRLYLMGRYHLNRLTDEGFWKALDYFRQALRQDPDYAAAHSGIALAYGYLSGFDAIPPEAGFPKARAAAEEALRLDDQLVEAHVALATVRFFYDWHWTAAETEYRRALELDPSSADAHQQYGFFLAGRARFAEADREMALALELDPTSVDKVCSVGEAQLLARRLGAAASQFRNALEMDPNFGFAYWSLGRTLAAQGDYDQAIPALQRSIPLSGDSPDEPAELARAYALRGDRPQALAILENLEQRSRSQYISPSLLAGIYAALGERDQAFALLERGRAGRDFFLVMLRVEPVFDPLRGDPRFADLLRAMQL